MRVIRRYVAPAALVVILLPLLALAGTLLAQNESRLDPSPTSAKMSKRDAEKLRRRIDCIPAANLVGALRGSTTVLGTTLQTSGGRADELPADPTTGNRATRSTRAMG